jgi:hypothetical protein
MHEHPTPPRKLRINPLGCVVIALVVIILIPTVAFWAYRARSAARLEKLLAEVRDRGEPTTAAEMEDYYALTAGAADPAPLWLAAVRRLESPAYVASAGDLPTVGTGEGEIPLPGEPWPLESKAEEHLARYAASLLKMHEAAAIGGPGRYPTDFDEGLAMQLPHAQALRSGARLLDLEARTRARRGDAHGAAESIHAMFMAAESLQLEPILISQLVRFAIAGVAAQTVEDLLPAVAFADEDLALLQADLERPDYHAGLQQAVLGEQFFGITIFTNPASLGDEAPSLNASRLMLMRDDDLALYLDCLQKYRSAAGEPWLQAMDEAAAVGEELETRTKTPAGRFRYPLTALLTPAMDAVFPAGARGEALLRVAATAVAVERFRLQHDRLPENLEQLAPEFLAAVPTDPFDGKPLRYVAGENGYTVYSIGRDGVDNGGKESARAGEPDVAFSVPAKPEQ